MSKRTPGVGLGACRVSDHTSVRLSFLWSERSVFGQVVMPALLKGQVSLSTAGQLISILQQLNGDLWGVEAAGVTDQSVWFSQGTGQTAVHLHLWGFWKKQSRKASMNHSKLTFHAASVQARAELDNRGQFFHCCGQQH